MNAAPSIELIVNADDFGQSPDITDGILHAHVHGIVTSTSLMVRWPHARHAVLLARNHPSLGIGLHVDLGEWKLQSQEWVPMYEVVDFADAEAVRCEISAQVARCMDLLGHPPTHLDSHQHAHLREPARSLMIKVAAELGVPLRHFAPGVRYCGEFYGQDIDGSPLHENIRVTGLKKILESCKPGITELACHPAAGRDLTTMYSAERLIELATLCDPEIRRIVSSMRLRSFARDD